MKALQLTLLGGFEARLSGQAVDVRSNKAKALLAYLALTLDKSHPRGKLVALLWSDRSEEQARHSLRQELNRMRRRLGEGVKPALCVERDSLALDGRAVEVDVAMFEQAVAEGTQDALEHAVALYRGEFLADLEVRDRAFEEWLRRERGRLRALAIEAHGKRLSHQMQGVGNNGATNTARRLLELDPFNERAHRVLMQAYAVQGERSLALTHYEDFVSALKEELGGTLEAETEQLYAAIRDAKYPGESRDQSAEPSPTDPVFLGASAASATLPPTSWTRHGRSWLIGAGVVVVFGVLVLMLRSPWEGGEIPTVEREAILDRAAGIRQVPLLTKPSIAVLPFTNLSADPEQEYFADGMTDDLITDLSKISGLFVIARNSTFTYKGKPTNIQQVAEELGVRYVLEGSVRRAENQIRINAQLTDATTGGHLWAERYDGTLADVFTLQDEVTQNIVTALAVQLTTTDQAAQTQGKTDNPKAYDVYLRGWKYSRLYSPESFLKAIPYLEEAIQLDPNYTRGHALLALIYYESWWNEWTKSLGMTSDEAKKSLDEHLEEAMKAPTPRASFVVSKMLSNEGRYDEAIATAQHIIDSNPSNYIGHLALTRAYFKAGRYAKGLDALNRTMELDPQGFHLYRLGEAQFHLKQYDDALQSWLRTTRIIPDDYWSFLYLAATYAFLGEDNDARSAIETFNKYREREDLKRYTLADLDSWPFRRGTNREHLREGLRRAGMPAGLSSLPEFEFSGTEETPTAVKGATSIDATKAKTLLDQGVPFVDVGGDPDWKAGHIRGAVHLELYNVFGEAKLAELVTKDDEVVIYSLGLDAPWPYSARACANAVSWGFKKVYYFREGISGWEAAGYPIAVPSG